MPTTSKYMGLTVPTVGGDANAWGGYITADLGLIDALAVYNVVAVSTSGNLSVYNGPAIVKATGGAGGISLALPDANASGANAGRVYIFVKVDSGAGAITVTTSMGQTISGASTANITEQWNGLIIQSDGANWVIIGTNSTGGIVTSSLATLYAGATLGAAGSAAGVLTLEGGTSGSCTITAPAVAGTPANPITVSNSISIASGTTYQINGSQITSAALSDTVADTPWSSTPTSLANVGGAPAITGRYARIGPIVYFTIIVTPVTSTSSTAGTTSFSLPIACTQPALCHAVDAAGVSLGAGNISTSAIYPPSWSADTSVVTIAGWYFAA